MHPGTSAGHLEPAFFVDPGRGAPSHPVLVHLDSKISTRIVSGTVEDVNAKLLIQMSYAKLSPEFRSGMIELIRRDHIGSWIDDCS